MNLLVNFLKSAFHRLLVTIRPRWNVATRFKKRVGPQFFQRRLTPAFIFIPCILLCDILLAVDDLQQQATWHIPTTQQVHAQLELWLNDYSLPDTKRQQLLQHWSVLPDPLTSASLLEHLLHTIVELEPGTKPFEALNSSSERPPSFDTLILNRTDLPRWVQHHLRLLYGRWLVDQTMYSEAHLQLHGLAPEDVITPATLLFYQSVVAHHLIDKESCLETISLMLENESQLPRRYVEVARLMQADIQPLENESLDEISRIMRNIHNRLEMGRAGKRVRTEEEKVLEKLEKLIDQMEQQAQSSEGEGSGDLSPANPAGDSVPLGGTGPGDVDPKPIEKKPGWGNLPPKERQEALQQISTDFPAHYRDIIEQYFKKLARDTIDK